MADKTTPDSGNRATLLDEFPAPTLEQWNEEVVRLLKGKPYDKVMLTPTYEGITLDPIYSDTDTENLPHTRALPGEKPFVRDTDALGYRTRPWAIAQELPYPTYEEFNEALRHDMERGQTAVNLVLDRATQAGRDPDQAEELIGRDGTSIASVKGLAKALEGVRLDRVPLLVEAGSAAVPFAALVVALMRTREEDVDALEGSLGMDPLAGLAEHGTLPLSLDRAMDELASLTAWAEKNAPRVKTLSVHGHPYHNAGASATQELGFMLAAAVEYLRQMERRGVELDTAARRIQFGTSVGTHFFMEVAKLRALRMLWARVAEAAGVGEEARKMTLHARTSRYTKTAWDPYVNLLRGTTEAFSALMGGADSLHVAPFDEPLGLPSEFSRRIARNTQIILRDEAHFDNVVDPAGGSWYLESLTDEVARKAWEIFQKIEGEGGMFAALKAGIPQKMVAEVAEARRGNLGTRRDVLVGINQYPNPDEEPMPRREPDWEAVRRQRMDTLQKLRGSDEHESDVKVLEKLQAVFDKNGEEAFEAIVEAAAAGATIGEFTSTLRHGEDDTPSVVPLTLHRAAEPFEKLRSAVSAWRGDSDTPQVFLANLGPVAGYMPRLDFARNFFQVGGYRVASDQWFETPGDAARAAADSGAPVAVIVGLDTTYAEQAVDAAERLSGAEGIKRVILAGMPKDILDDLKAAGVDEFIHLKSDVLASLEGLADTIGVQR